jgi:replicative DNA helicase
MLLSASAIASAVEVVSREDFYKPAHGHIFEAITSLYGSGEPIDPVTVAEELRRANLLDAIGGPAVLVDLQATTPAISNAGGYAHIVEEHALLRRLIGVAGEIAELGYSVPDDVTKAVDRAEAMVYDVAQRRVADTMSPVHDLLEISLSRLEQLYDRGESITGLPTGYNDLDELLSGLQPSSLVVVGARPSVGKCVAWDTPILDPVTGALRTAAEVHRIGTAGHPVAVASLGGDGSLTVVEPEAFVDDGIKPVFRVRTRSGREVRTTITHPFLTERGWLPLGDLGVGVRVAVPHALPFFGSDRLPAAEVVLLAHLDGRGRPRRPRRRPRCARGAAAERTRRLSSGGEGAGARSHRGRGGATRPPGRRQRPGDARCCLPPSPRSARTLPRSPVRDRGDSTGRGKRRRAHPLSHRVADDGAGSAASAAALRCRGCNAREASV